MADVSLQQHTKQRHLERVHKLAGFIVVYLNSGLKIRHLIRVAFDEIDCRNRNYVTNQDVCWNFKSRSMKRRANAERILKHFPHISELARKELRHIVNCQTPSIALQCDHVIPLKRLEKMLKEQHRQKTMDANAVIDFHRKFFRRCILTKDEHEKLTSSSMPNGWTPDSTLFARYKEANFNWSDDWN